MKTSIPSAARTAALLVCALAVAPLPARAQEREEDDDRAAVLAVVQEFFDAMTAADSARTGAIMLRDGMNYGIRLAPEYSLAPYSTADYIASLPNRETRIVERIWDPTVLLHGPLAVVWAPYDIYGDGEFLHCGVDTFTLLRTDGGWKIASVAFTMEPTGCEPSPLGPLEDAGAE
ncbi:MAG TPA: nuclear transport factor 2 family protein [Gemmatimonadota bacterium]|nr:nuclear transport factor 2 family protein [Gemmatimonadota bacterium]